MDTEGNRLKVNKKGQVIVLMTVTLAVMIIFAGPLPAVDLHTWEKNELDILRSLWIETLPPLPEDPSNAYADDPRAIALGKKFFFDSRFSGNLKVSCATCHPQNMNFADNLPLAHGMGTTTRRTMPLIGAAYYTWLFWDGRKDSLWAQALGPLESPVEHGFTRTHSVLIIYRNYLKEYEDIFGPLPTDLFNHKFPTSAKPSPDEPASLKAWILISRGDRQLLNRVYANMGKAIAAFVRTIVPEPATFDRYVSAAVAGDTELMLSILTNEEVKGLRLFIGKAKCTNCHNGPLFTNGDFHNINVPQPSALPADSGREEGIAKVLSDEFNCLGAYSDAGPGDCAELRFMDTRKNKYSGAFKTPTLRNVAERAPYMHAGQFATLRDVLEFYRKSENPELAHGGLSISEISQLEAFLRTLSGPVKFAE